jgi:hypothetical protein
LRPSTRATHRGPAELLAQLGLVVTCALLYFGVRGLTVGRPDRATAHGEGILRFEQTLGIAVERTMQGWVLAHQVLVKLANWVYLYGHWPVIIVVLIWLYARRRAHYYLLRNAMIVSGGIGLVIYATFPVAPPRFLGAPFVDTVKELTPSGRFKAPGFVNEYAAMPSLHVGWNLLVGIVLFAAASAWIIRAFAVLNPVAMAFAVVLTANHYIVDVIAGCLIALCGLFIATRWRGRHPDGGHRDRAGPSTRRQVPDQLEVVDDEPVDAALDQPARVLGVAHAPRQDVRHALPQAAHHPWFDQA